MIGRFRSSGIRAGGLKTASRALALLASPTGLPRWRSVALDPGPAFRGDSGKSTAPMNSRFASDRPEAVSGLQD